MNGLHRSSLSGDALLANQLMMNNGVPHKERHPLGMTTGGNTDQGKVSGVHDSSDFNARRQQIRKTQASKSARRNCCITFIVVFIVLCLIAAGVVAYLLGKFLISFCTGTSQLVRNSNCQVRINRNSKKAQSELLRIRSSDKEFKI